MLREFKFYFKKNIKIITIIYIQVTVMLLLIGTFFYFFDSIDSVETGFKEVYSGKSMFQISNDYYNEKGEEFSKNNDTLSIKKEFYNKLNNEENFEYLSIKEHYISVNSDIIPDESKIVYSNNEYQFEKIEDKEYTMVKSIQMNRKSYDFFDLKVSEGRVWNNSDFKYNGYIPILLGSNYKKIFNIGDKIEIGYFGTKFNAEIIGFIKEDSSVLGNGNIQMYLNEYILLPHINFEDPSDSVSRDFQEVVYFMMLEGYIVTEDNIASIQNMKDKVEILSQESGFIEYFFIGANPYLKSYTNTITILRENKDVIFSILSLISIFNFMIISILFWIKNNRRISYYSIHYMHGANKSKLLIQQWLEIEIIFLFSFFTYFLISYEILYLYNFKVYLILFILINLMSTLICIISSRNIIRKSIGSGLNCIENGGM